MQHLARVFETLGLRTCLLSPAHLRWADGRAEICASFASGYPDFVVRFFPAEWLPNLASDKSWTPYFQDAQTPVSNPGSAIALQTKRFPMVWSDLEANLSTWRALLPETRGIGEGGSLHDERWVIKPVLGRVGEGVGIRGITPPTELHKILQEARRAPQQWIAQRRFSILPVMTETGEQFPCIGVFTVGGKASGFYGRISKSPIINQHARDVAVLVSEAPEGRA
jgi:glutathionylspermidine synthase